MLGHHFTRSYGWRCCRIVLEVGGVIGPTDGVCDEELSSWSKKASTRALFTLNFPSAPMCEIVGDYVEK